MKFISILTFLSVWVSSVGQVSDITGCNLPFQGDYYTVKAKSGLNFRSKPSLDSEILYTLPYGTRVFSCSSREKSYLEKIGGQKGFWLESFYKNFQGYVFNTFLEKEKIKIYFPHDYIGAIEKPIFKSDSKYYGIRKHFDESISPKTNLVISDYIGSEYISESSYYGKHRRININKNTPEIIITGLEPSPNLVYNGKTLHKMIYPGEVISDGGFYLYAVGEVQLKEELYHSVKSIDNYRLILRKSIGDGLFKEQTLCERTIHYYKDGMVDNGVFVKLLGDLDGDDWVDLIITYSEGCVWETVLLLSSKSIEGELLGEIARYKSAGC